METCPECGSWKTHLESCSRRGIAPPMSRHAQPASTTSPFSVAELPQYSTAQQRVRRHPLLQVVFQVVGVLVLVLAIPGALAVGEDSRTLGWICFFASLLLSVLYFGAAQLIGYIEDTAFNTGRLHQQLAELISLLRPHLDALRPLARETQADKNI